MMETLKGKIALGLVMFMIPLVVLAVSPRNSWAQLAVEVNGLAFWRGGITGLVNDRQNELFTDLSSGLTGSKPNDDTLGWFVGAGLNIPLWGFDWGHVLLGEIAADFRKFGSEEAGFPIGAGGEGFVVRDVNLTQVSISFSPKYRFDNFSSDRRIKPWIIPVGMSIGAVAPPSASVQLIDIGTIHGVGIDYQVTNRLVVGLDVRYHLNAGLPGIESSNFTAGGMVGIRF